MRSQEHGRGRTRGWKTQSKFRTQISLDPDVYEDAREEARKQEISFAGLIGRALAQILPPRDTEASRTIDAVVYGRDRPWATARFWIRGLLSPERERI